MEGRLYIGNIFTYIDMTSLANIFSNDVHVFELYQIICLLYRTLEQM